MYTQDLCTFLYMCTSVKSKLHKQKYFLDKGRKMERRGGKKEGRKGGREGGREGGRGRRKRRKQKERNKIILIHFCYFSSKYWNSHHLTVGTSPSTMSSSAFNPHLLLEVCVSICHMGPLSPDPFLLPVTSLSGKSI